MAVQPDRHLLDFRLSVDDVLAYYRVVLLHFQLVRRVPLVLVCGVVVAGCTADYAWFRLEIAVCGERHPVGIKLRLGERWVVHSVCAQRALPGKVKSIWLSLAEDSHLSVIVFLFV